jgi:hypothetical protein
MEITKGEGERPLQVSTPVDIRMSYSVSGEELTGRVSLRILCKSHHSLPPILVGVGDRLGRESSAGLVLQHRHFLVVSC